MAGESEDLPLGYSSVIITSFCSPMAFWCHEERGKGMTQSKMQLTQIEKKMIEDFARIGVQCAFTPSDGELVAVFHPVMQLWVRGAVKSWKPNVGGDLFLVDYGYTLHNFKKVRRLPEYARDLPPQAIQLFQIGMLPVATKFLPQTNKFERTTSDRWTPAASNKVREIFMQSKNTCFNCLKMVKNIAMGDILTIPKNGNSYISLKDVLCGSDLAEPADFNAFSTYHDKLVTCHVESTNATNLVTVDEPPDPEVAPERSHHVGQGSKPVTEQQQLARSPQKTKPRAELGGSPVKDAAPSGSDNIIFIREELPSTEQSEMLPPMFDLSKQQMLPVLVQGCNMSTPLDVLNKVPLHRNVHHVLRRLHCVAMTNQQKHMWSAIFRGQNVLAVGPSDSGKTLGYVVPLASSLLEPGLYREVSAEVELLQGPHVCVCLQLNYTNGPLALVLCATAEKACKTEAWFRMLTSKDPEGNLFSESAIQILLTYGGGAEREKLMEVINGCQVLISTPPCLLRILDFWRGVITDFDRLCHLVFDDADILFGKFNDEITEILQLCKKSLEVKERNERQMQVISVARHWTEPVEQFAARVLPDPTIIVSSGFELLAYSKIVPTIHRVTPPSSHESIVQDLVTEREQNTKMVIICSTDDEAKKVHAILADKKCVNLLLVHEKMDRFAVEDVKSRWFSKTSTQPPILVASDEVFSEMHIFDASCLVHYTMPSSKTLFNRRIASVINTCPNQFVNPEERSPKPKIHILMDERDDLQIPAIVEFLKKMKAEIPAGFEEKCAALLLAREEAKSKVPLCDKLCNFGECSNKNVCRDRHAFLPGVDECPPHLPHGEVKLKVLHVQSATHYSARLEEARDVQGEKRSLVSKEHVHLPLDMSAFYDKQANSDNWEYVSEEETSDPEMIVDACAVTAASGQVDMDVLDITTEDIFSQTNLDEMHENTNSNQRKRQLHVPEGVGGNNKQSRLEENQPQAPATTASTQKDNQLIEEKADNQMIQERAGNLFDAPEHVSLAHCIAEDLIMYSGIAREFKDRFGNEEFLKSQKKRCGEVAHLQSGGRYVFYLIVKPRTSARQDPALIGNLQRSLLALRKLCTDFGVRELAVPKIGKGNLKLEWHEVKSAFEDAFHGSGITITVYDCVVMEKFGDLFGATSKFSLAHCVAADFKMTQGVALQFRTRFGHVGFLRSQCKAVGEVAVLKLPQKYIFYLVTKQESTIECKPQLPDISKCLQQLRALCDELHIKFLAMPRIGSGIDQLEWSVVKEEIGKSFLGSETNITVFLLPEPGQGGPAGGQASGRGPPPARGAAGRGRGNWQ